MSQMLRRQLNRAMFEDEQDANPFDAADEQPSKPLTEGLALWWQNGKLYQKVDGAIVPIDLPVSVVEHTDGTWTYKVVTYQ